MLCEDNTVENLAKLEHVYRYKDDLLFQNDFGLSERVLSDIYPNISVRKTNFVDLTISI